MVLMETLSTFLPASSRIRAARAFFFAAALVLAAPLSGLAGEADTLVGRGDALDLRNKNREALDLYLQADGLRPDDAEILRRIAKQYAQLMVEAPSRAEQVSLAKKALEAAERAAALDPENAKARLSLAIVLGRAAQLEPPKEKVAMSMRIRDEAAAAVRLDPRDDLAWHVLGRWNYELANFNPLLKSIAQVIYGRFPDASNERAAEYFRKAIAVGPPRAVNHIELGRTLAAMGDKDGARREIEKGLSIPDSDKDDPETKRRGRKTLETL